jgi:hypothetical protein
MRIQVQAFSSPAAAREQILTDIGSVSALYQRSFNISLGECTNADMYRPNDV